MTKTKPTKKATIVAPKTKQKVQTVTFNESFNTDVKRQKTRNFITKSLFFIISIAILSGVVYGGMFVYDNYIKTGSLFSSQTKSEATGENTQKTATNNLEKLKKILMIDEMTDKDGKSIEPAIATISDKELVKKSNPEFYKNVENNDMLVIYPSRVIIYRESENKIINVAPISASQSSQTQPTNPDQNK
jgi:hypothetical protein